jgi:predicted transcriptional regulator
MKYKKQFMHIRIPDEIREELKNLALFRHTSMTQIVVQALIEKLERDRRYFLNNKIPKP